VNWPDFHPKIDHKKLSEELGRAVAPGLNSQADLSRDEKRRIKTTANLVVKAVNDFGNEMVGSFRSHLSQMETVFIDCLESSLRDFILDERRSQLLWWRQTLFSPFSRMSYRWLDPCQAALVMAIDLHKMVTLYAPQSVEYLLCEATQALIEPIRRDRLTLDQFCNELLEDDNLINCKLKIWSEKESLISKNPSKSTYKRKRAWVLDGMIPEPKITSQSDRIGSIP
jgi:chemotaxis protein CheY-P-specific phosphatase CheC